MGKLVDMKRTKAERAAEKKSYDSPVSGGDDYPYGLRVRLDHEMLEKLGVKSLPKVGDKVHLHAKAHVKSVEESSHDGGRKRRHVELEMRHMALEPPKKGTYEGTPGDDDGDTDEKMAKGAKSAMDEALGAKGKQKGVDAED